MEIINYNVDSGTYLPLNIGHQFDHKNRIITFDGYEMQNKNNTLYFNFDKDGDEPLMILLSDYSFEVTQPLTLKDGSFIGQLVEFDTNDNFVSHSKVFECIINKSIKTGSEYELHDPSLDLYYTKMVLLYNELKEKLASDVLKGDKGDKGEKGDSVYQVALNNGFVGSEQDFINSLKYDHSEEFQRLAQQVKDDYKASQNLINGFTQNVNSYTQDFNANAQQKTLDYNSNATTKANEFNENATSKLNEYNNNDVAKTKSYNDNANEKTQELNTIVENAQTNIDDGVELAQNSEQKAKEYANRIQESANQIEINKQNIDLRVKQPYVESQNETYLDDSDDGAIRNMIMRGKSTQLQNNTTPSPTTPSEIVNVDRIDIKVSNDDTSEEQTISLQLPFPLKSSLDGTIYDYIDVEREKYVQRLGELVLNGEENGWSVATSQDSSQNDYFINNNIIKNSNITNGIFSHFKIANPYNDYTNCAYVVNNQVRIRINNINNVTDFKQWLRENNVTMVYALANPIETDIPQVDLDKLRALKTYYNITNIAILDQNGNSVGNSFLYKILLKNYIEKIAYGINNDEFTLDENGILQIENSVSANKDVVEDNREPIMNVPNIELEILTLQNAIDVAYLTMMVEENMIGG